jgi:hypothetical protein
LAPRSKLIPNTKFFPRGESSPTGVKFGPFGRS